MESTLIFFCHGVDNPIVLLEDDESNASNSEAVDGSLHAESAEPDVGFSSSLETAVDSRPLAPPSNPEGCHEIERNDFTETAQRLRFAEQEASTSDPMRPYGPSSRPSSELLHDRIGTEDLYTHRARSEATMSNSARSRS